MNKNNINSIELTENTSTNKSEYNNIVSTFFYDL